MNVQVQGSVTGAHGDAPEPRVRRGPRGVMAAFIAAGVAFAGLASRLPDMRALLGLGPSQLGLLLLAVAAGAVLSLPTSGWLAGRIGAGRAVLVGRDPAEPGLAVAGLGTASAGGRRGRRPGCSWSAWAPAPGTWR